MKRYWFTAGLVAAIAAFSGCATDDAPILAEDGVDQEVDPGNDATTGVAKQALDGAPDDVYIVSINGNGPGCPAAIPGSLTSDILEPDRQTFVVYLNDMQLQHPPGATYLRRNCVVGITLHVPQGWQFSLATINTRGFAKLPVGAWARQTSSYFFAGVPLGGAARSRLNGVYDNIYEFTDYVGIESLVWSPCGKNAIFNINTAIELDTSNNATANAFMSNDTIDGTFQKVVGWQWRQCT